MILSLVNNWDAFGGKKQYVQWARDQGHHLGSDEDFFTDGLTRAFYKNHVKVCTASCTCVRWRAVTLSLASS